MGSMVSSIHSPSRNGSNSVPMRSRVARGSLWLGGGSGMENVLRILRNMILARIMAPQAFGLMAIVIAVNGAFDSFTEIGIKEAIIQNPHGSGRAYLNAAWWVSFIRGLGLYLIGFLAAPWIASFYHQPELQPMLRVAMISIVFSGMMSVRAYGALKKMNYLPWVLITHGGNILGVTTAIVLGLCYKSVWALVVGFTVESLARCVISYIACPFWPRLRLHKDSLRALMHYASGMIGLPILTLLYAKSDIFVVGKICSATELGMYSMAMALAYIPDVICVTVIAPLLMPAFSSIQHDTHRLTSSVLSSLKYLAFIFLPILTLMACGAPLILSAVYGKPYAAVSGTFALLCAAMALKILGWGLVTTFFATGRPELSRRASLVRLVVLIVLIIPLVSRLGLPGAALAGLCSGAAWVVYNVMCLRKMIGLSVTRYLAALSSGVAASAVICIIWIFLRW